jgi:predicted O-linked N-acetylglucosamine transferase (SPINDLY family)
LPAQSYDDFLSLLAISDVVLDPLHFGGGNSSYEALAMRAPIVTLPGPFLRGRITSALYSKMNFTDLIVHSPEQYVTTAVRLATDREFKNQVRRRIADANSILFEDPEELRGLEQFLESVPLQRPIACARAREKESDEE